MIFFFFYASTFLAGALAKGKKDILTREKQLDIH